MDLDDGVMSFNDIKGGGGKEGVTKCINEIVVLKLFLLNDSNSYQVTE